MAIEVPLSCLFRLLFYAADSTSFFLVVVVLRLSQHGDFIMAEEMAIYHSSLLAFLSMMKSFEVKIIFCYKKTV